jgi:Vitamin K-dependent gamma-carboxylase
MLTTLLSAQKQVVRLRNKLQAVFGKSDSAFFFPCSSDSWLTILRIGLGTQVVLYCLSLRNDWTHLFANKEETFINRGLMEDIIALDAPFTPKLGWLVTLGTHLGVNEQTMIWMSWISLISASLLLTVGLFCRGSAITTWFLYLCSVKSGNLLTYGVDNFTTIGLFYLVFAPFPDRYTLDWKLRRSPLKDRHLHGFFRRVLQLHLCVIYFFGGLAKFLGIGWWNGESLWRALTRPPFNVVPVHTILSFKAALPVTGITVWMLEMSYTFFIWPKRTRPVWLVMILGMHIAIGLTLGLYLFALVMIVLNLAAFGPGSFDSRKSDIVPPKPGRSA